MAKAALELRRRQNSGLGLLDWTSRYRKMLKPEMPLDFGEHPYLIDLYQAQAQELVVYKAAQMGASEYAVSFALWSADVRKATILYVFPTDVAVSDFSSARIGPAIEASPYLSQLIVDGSDDRAGADRVTLKRVGDRFMYLRGAKISAAGMAPQLKSIDADVLVLDEIDEMDERAPAIALKRLGHSKIAEIRYISTPTYPGRGIHARWIESDQREWFVPCPHCGHKQFLTIQHFVFEWDSLGRPLKWDNDGKCEKCRGSLDRLAPGEWVAREPSKKMVGFHLTKLFSPLITVEKIVHNLQTTDETVRRETFNQDLGETYTPKGGQLTDEIINACRRNYAWGPRMDTRTIAGVDVGKVLHCVIRAPGYADVERQQIWAGIVDSWEELGRIFRMYRVRTAVIDAMPEVTKAREFQRDYRGAKIWLAYYTVQSKHPDPWEFKEKEGHVIIDRTRAMDVTFSRFYEKINTLPAGIRDNRDYYAHMKAQVRVIEDKSGIPTATYIESGPDHYAHAENYCTVAERAPRMYMGVIAQGSVKGW